MKRLAFFVVLITMIGCEKKSSLASDDIEYVRTTVDLLRTRAALSMTTDSLPVDSVRVKSALDSVYRLHRTTREAFLNWSTHLADDPKHAAAFYEAVNDSIARVPGVQQAPAIPKL